MRRQTKNKIRYLRLYVIGVPIAVFIILNVYWAIGAASFGARLANLEQKAFNLQKENSELSSQLIGATSLGSLSVKTESMGFVKPSQIVYINEGELVAKLP
ncbi:hypothetical protein HYT59_01680 [Candidatus Woesebacteria bacterium]|nr:hypothetical protein [Candidatus Woesebacteria bacterium]